MYKQAVLLAAACGLRVAHADVLIITSGTYLGVGHQEFTNTADEQAWATKVSSIVSVASDAYYKTVDPRFVSQESAAVEAISKFVATQTKYSIPSALLADNTTVTYKTVPAWVTALPSDVQSAFLRAEQEQISLNNEIANSINALIVTTSSAQTSAGTTLVSSPSANGTLSTGTPTATSSSTESPKPSSGASRAVGAGAGLLVGALAGLIML